MTSFINLNLPSDDSDDSDYEESQPSEAEEEKPKPSRVSNAKAQAEATLRQKRALKALELMTQEALGNLVHQPAVCTLQNSHRASLEIRRCDRMTCFLNFTSRNWKSRSNAMGRQTSCLTTLRGQ